METKYVTDRTSTFFKNNKGRSGHMVLIFGDEVVATAAATPEKRVPVTFRTRAGFVAESDLGGEAPLEMYFIDVGQGDSTFIVTPGRKNILIDGGRGNRALAFLNWKYRLDKGGGPVDIDLLVVSHADADHINGLTNVIEHPAINVRRVVHSGIATFDDDTMETRLGNRDPTGTFLTKRHSTLADLSGDSLSDSFQRWVDAIEQDGAEYGAVDTRTGAIDLDPAVGIEVVGPLLERVDPADPASPLAYRWFDGKFGGTHKDTINGHSVVLRLRYRDVLAFFSGDLNPKASDHLLGNAEVAAKLPAHVFKAPHHGSHEYRVRLLEAVRPQVSVISSGDAPDYGHPRANFLGALGRASRTPEPLIFSTEIARTFVDAGELPASAADPSLETLDFADAQASAMAHRLFKQRLPGMINVRTNGRQLFAARRMVSGWESYGPIEPVA